MGLDLIYADFALRPLATGDAALSLAWRNQPAIRASMYNDQVIAPDEHERWLARVTADASCSYHVFEHRGRPIGSVGFYAISRQHGRGEWTFYIGDGKAVRGAGGAMLFFAVELFFNMLRLDKLCGETLSSNPKSATVHERLGFKSEGIRRRHIRRGDEMLDVTLYALFADDWRPTRQAQYRALFR